MFGIKWLGVGARLDGLWLFGLGRHRSSDGQRWPFGGQDRIRVLGVFDFLGHFQDQWDFQNGCGSFFDLADLAVDSGQSQLFGEFDGAGGFPIFEVRDAAGATA